MLNSLSNAFTGLFGSRNQRLLKSYSQLVNRINAFEPEFEALDDGAIKTRSAELRQRVQAGTSVDEALPEAFALVREAARRTLSMRHFDVQLIGGIALHEGKISEMRTGEGKTLVATLPAYLNALTGDGVHIVTVNEYLAQRDAEWMRPVYEFLGLEVGVIKSGQTPPEKRAMYSADITYGTNNEFGFDYLRDNLAFRLEDQVQKRLAYAIVDEVDSILIDEARTPLIISGRSEESTELYVQINRLIPSLNVYAPPAGAADADIKATRVSVRDTDGSDLGEFGIEDALTLAAQKGGHLIETDALARPAQCQLVEPGDYTVDEKSKQAHLTEEGHDRAEELLLKAKLIGAGQSLYDPANIRLMHHLNAALRAHALFKREVDYIINEGEIVIVDEFTGRTMPGRRWSDGLHQAIEAKEGVRVKEENQTVASITFQNYFRLYGKLAGMTGTADTEAYEFQQIYGLEVVVIPTHMPMVRDDAADLVYLTQKDKFEALIEDIQDCHDRGQPVLVGTTSIETSEFLSGLLKKAAIKHQVLNAKYHESEAEIIVQAGRPGTVTIATNMAGRGTDIVLGGNVEAELKALGDIGEAELARLRAEWAERHETVINAGGLHIIGTERHESRRIDNQLRGRSGRQGDPGSSRFYLSMEDNLMRIFGDPERTKRLLSRAGMKEGEAIESRLLSRQIERAQRKVEAHNFDIRKQLLEYDDVANDQRKVIYQQRSELMEAAEIGDAIEGIRAEVVNTVIDDYIPPQSVEELWDKHGLTQAIEREFAVHVDVAQLVEDDPELDEQGVRDKLCDLIEAEYDAKVADVGAQVMRGLEKAVMLQQLDSNWKEHIAALDYLRQGIHLRGYAQRNPKQEYKREAFDMFSEMLDRVKHETVAILSKVQIRRPEDAAAVDPGPRDPGAMSFQHAAAPTLTAAPPPLAVGAPAPAPGGAPLPADPVAPYVREQPKVGRNQPCPCGSGKKFKQCHGQLQ
ncbi:MAG: preprotein translocase subunit SecA [Gammaproteobacteria bacterium]|nr:preprotein translocase subunit SecA [Gammaproteobacteria bacterium]MDH3505992.1 preprotein translocase subunit SecA [Gammaproteobacteria bacterium]